MKKILYPTLFATLMALTLPSCDDYLDEMPDNRTEIDSEDKVVSLITSAYPDIAYIMLAEIMSDNIDDMGDRYSNYTGRFVDQAFAWEDITESNNDGIRTLWEECYNAIANANEALDGIEDIGGATTTTLKEAKAEALLCRAYSHFILTNMFCLNYNTSTSSTDLGIPYMDYSETTVESVTERGTVAEDYEMMDKDIQEALPLIGDTHLEVPKYHFNTQAAYAFATRFYLFYEQWDKAAEYATKCLGTNPSSMLRDWDEMESYGITSDLTPRTNLYIDDSAKSNLLLITAISSVGLWSGNYAYYSKYTHDYYLASTETLMATQIWGGANYYTYLRCVPLQFSAGTLDRVLVAKLPYLFEELDEVAGTGYYRTVYPAFKADLTLLERAEAYVMMGEYDKAASDLTTWMQNWTTSTRTLTPDYIQSFYNNLDYYEWDAPTLKKHLNPAFSIDAEGSVQECMLQCVLNFKRLETTYEGFRWFDVKRYGIEVYRRVMDSAGEPESVSDLLTVGDKRRAIQLPQLVISSGMEENPR